MTGSITAILYLRVARPHTAEHDDPLDAQRQAVIHRAEQLGASIVEEFHDTRTSPRRDGLEALLSYVSEHDVNYCIVPSIDTLARTIGDYTRIDAALRDNGVALVTATGNSDHTDCTFAQHVTAMMAAWPAHGPQTEPVAV